MLSPDARLVELTAVVSLPGAFAQDPHADVLEDDPDHPARATDADPTPIPSRPPNRTPRFPAQIHHPHVVGVAASGEPLETARPSYSREPTRARDEPARMAPRAVRAGKGRT